MQVFDFHLDVMASLWRIKSYLLNGLWSYHMQSNCDGSKRFKELDCFQYLLLWNNFEFKAFSVFWGDFCKITFRNMIIDLKNTCY